MQEIEQNSQECRKMDNDIVEGVSQHIEGMRPIKLALKIGDMPKEGENRVSKYLEAVPVSARGCLTRAMGKTGGRMNAIKAKCLDCSGWDRAEIADCLVLTCPLHPWRPFQVKP